MTDPTEERFLTSAQVRRRYGDVSHVWIFRRERDGSGFPIPLVIGNRKLWRLSDLEEWEATLSKKHPRLSSHLDGRRRHDAEATEVP
jgi:hypothetical protein